jgi:tetratricopeptide (TPR) repeat protein
MSKIDKALQTGYAAYQRGAFAEARRSLQRVKHPKAVHLLGLVEKADGNLEKALQLLQRAAALDSRDPEVANNLGQTAKQLGRRDLAETQLRRALKLRADFQQAAISLGQLLLDQERYAEAAEIYTTLLDRIPTDIYVRHGLGSAVLGLGQAERAATLFDELINEGIDRPEVRFMRARARLELGQTEAGIDDLQNSHAGDPTVLSLKALANCYWMNRDQSAFDKLLDDALANEALAVSAAELLRQSGEPRKALAALAKAASLHSLPPAAASIAATAHIDLHEAAQAEALAREAIALIPQDALLRRNLIVSLLMQGKADDAMPFIEELRAREPNDQQWIAYEASALRLMGDERYTRLVDLERFVRPYYLPTPDGFEKLADFNAAFLHSLSRLHRDTTHPLNQSLRDGSQSPRDLTKVDDPVIQAFYRALDGPIRQYMADVGSGSDHPLTARNTGNYRFAGAWSVKLRGGGKHVNHVHPEGWISSSYYVAVPDETTTDENRAGWIKFSEPPFPTTPPSPAEKWVRPEAGMLVLFPSFLWHGTEAIHDGSLRVTAPFDAVPV